MDEHVNRLVWSEVGFSHSTDVCNVVCQQTAISLEAPSAAVSLRIPGLGVCGHTCTIEVPGRQMLRQGSAGVLPTCVAGPSVAVSSTHTRRAQELSCHGQYSPHTQLTSHGQCSPHIPPGQEHTCVCIWCLKKQGETGTS